MEPKPIPLKSVENLTDEEIFDEIREQVNKSRNSGTHDRERTRAVAGEMRKRREAERTASTQSPN